jgi:hypothetical protein
MKTSANSAEGCKAIVKASADSAGGYKPIMKTSANSAEGYKPIVKASADSAAGCIIVRKSTRKHQQSINIVSTISLKPALPQHPPKISPKKFAICFKWFIFIALTYLNTY